MLFHYYRIWLLLGTLCCILASCFKDAELPATDGVELEVTSEWREHAFHCSATESWVEDKVQIEERGFVFIFENDYSWGVDGETVTKVMVPKEENFQCSLKGNWGEGVSCRIYAYANMKNGNYRSEIITRVTGESESPVIKSVTNIPSEQGMHRGGKIIIEGQGFSTILKKNKVYLTDWGESPLEVIEATTEKIVVTYDAWLQTGEFTIKLVVDKYECISKIVFRGPMIVGHEPLHPRYGDIVTLYMKDFSATDNFGLSVENYIYPEKYQCPIVSISDDEIKIRLFSIKKEIGISLLYNDTWVCSQAYKISLDDPWKIHSVPDKGYYASSISFNNQKAYSFDYQNSRLRCFDSETEQWSYYDVKLVPEYRTNADSPGYVFSSGNYVYVSWAIMHYNTTNGEVTYEDHYYRFNINTRQWQDVSELSKEMDIRAQTASGEGDIVYVWSPYNSPYIRKYHTTSGLWESTTDKIPDGMYMIGRYNDAIYCSNRSSIYKIKQGQLELVYDFLKDSSIDSYWDNEDYLCTLSGNYIYLPVTRALFRIDISKKAPQLESLGRLEDYNALTNTLAMPFTNKIFLLSHEYYQATLYRYLE